MYRPLETSMKYLSSKMGGRLYAFVDDIRKSNDASRKQRENEHGELSFVEFLLEDFVHDCYRLLEKYVGPHPRQTARLKAIRERAAELNLGHSQQVIEDKL